MKKGVLILFVLFSICISAQQIVIKGKVTSNTNTPLEGASVFLNNTTIGVLSNNLGEFELKAPEGDYILVVYYMGYITFQKPISYKENSFVNVQLQEASELLDEVVLNAKKRKRTSPKKHYDFKRFRDAFIGNTKFSKSCTIENPEVLEYYYDDKMNKLLVKAKKPIEITNKKLGYKLFYDLINFSMDHNRTSFHGYTRYTELKGNKRQLKRWRKNRLKAYNGSLAHFFKSLFTANVKEEGFLINQFKRDTIILKNGKKFRNTILKQNLDYHNIVYRVKGDAFLNFKHLLEVTYTKEKEESNYRPSGRRLNKQISILNLTDKHIQIYPSGKLSNPLAIHTEQYWSYEKMGDLLPLNYQPN